MRQGIKNLSEICHLQGIKTVVISPGSRNAPLIMSFAKHSHLKCISITDERSAAYFALGVAQFSQKPVALVCTSGTAVLNYAPAIAEAYYQNIPLVIFTADRPAEMIDQADGQTIRQTNVFSNYIKRSFTLPLETANENDLWFFNRSVFEAIDIAVKHPQGPVHLNVPLREPLNTPLPTEYKALKRIETISTIPFISEIEMNHFQNKWAKCSKKIILVGIHPKNNDLNDILNQFSERNDTIIFAENLSNCTGDKIISTLEPFFASLTEEEKKDLQPDILITIGHSIVSKRIKNYLRTYQPMEHWHIDSSDNYIDTYKTQHCIISTSPEIFLNLLVHINSLANSLFSNKYIQHQTKLSKIQETFFENTTFSDIPIIKYILKTVPSSTVLHLSNSTPVRFAQLFASRNDVTYFSNRGTSGIDGCVSTAVGSAHSSNLPTVLITGDLAFIYDSNGLWNKNLPKNLKIIVINNNGGNIFRLIDTNTETEDVREFFETPHNVNIGLLAGAFGVSHSICNNQKDLLSKLAELYSATNTSILEIVTNADTNTSVFKEFYKQIQNI